VATKPGRDDETNPFGSAFIQAMRDGVIALAIGLFSVNLAAQVVPISIREGGPDAALRERKNAWTVGIVGGLLSGTYMRFVDEMASVLNDGDNLRIRRWSPTARHLISTTCSIFAASTRP
jgi:hypothetical protein